MLGKGVSTKLRHLAYLKNLGVSCESCRSFKDGVCFKKGGKFGPVSKDDLCLWHVRRKVNEMP
jgi:hypothetical protein